MIYNVLVLIVLYLKLNLNKIYVVIYSFIWFKVYVINVWNFLEYVFEERKINLLFE